jgi:hypothetical protein
MLKRPEGELQFVKSRDRLPSVEVDLDCIPEELHGYGDLIANAITPVAARSSNMRATIYVYHGPSSNFHQKTWSAFFAVAGDKKLLDVLLNAFRGAKLANARFSDYIDPSTATIEFHVQDGHVWCPFESGTWYTGSQDEEAENLIEEDGIKEIDDSESATPEVEAVTARLSQPSRFRAARADATIVTIRRTIEEVFGLPEGSVALCGPDKRALRGDATIATLRKRWE